MRPSVVLSRWPQLLAALAVASLVTLPVSAREATADPEAISEEVRLTAELDAIFTSTYPAGSPGASVLVRHGERVLLSKGYGSANIELDVPLDARSVFRIGSITKQFTAVAILMLVEDGTLRLDQTLADALPDYPEAHASKVTIEHLLTHTSGIPSYTEDSDFWPNARNDHSHEEMYAYFADDELEFEPGSQWKYNNSGYYLLGAIIEAASGESYGAFLRQKIFRPLGMHSTFVDQPGRVVHRRVQGYQTEPGVGFRNAEFISMTCPGAAGAMLSTVGDLDRWNTALGGDKLLSRELLDKAWTSYVLGDGEATHYGYGWMIGSHHGADGRVHPVIEHGGGIHGFTTYAMRLPDEQIFVTVLSNGHPAPPVRAARIAAGLVLGEDPHPDVVEVPAATLERYVGVYRIDEDSSRVVTVGDGFLFTRRDQGQRHTAWPVSETEFFYPERLTYVSFEVDAEGRVAGMTLRPWSGEPEHAFATAEPIPTGPRAAEVDLSVFDAYAGRYELAPGFILELRREGDQMVGQATGQGPVTLTPSSETELFNDMIGLRIEFTAGDPPTLTLFQAGQEIPAGRLPPD